MKFKKGDRVRVKQKKDIDTSGNPGWNSYMDLMSGKEYILEKKSGNWWTLPDEDDDLWLFKEDWLEKIEETPKFKVGDKIQVKRAANIERKEYLAKDIPERSVGVFFFRHYEEETGEVIEVDEDGDVRCSFDSLARSFFHPMWLEVIEEPEVYFQIKGKRSDEGSFVFFSNETCLPGKIWASSSSPTKSKSFCYKTKEEAFTQIEKIYESESGKKWEVSLLQVIQFPGELEITPESRKFKVGDQVRIKPKSEIKKLFISEKDESDRRFSISYDGGYANKILTISKIDKDGDLECATEFFAPYYHPSWVEYVKEASSKTYISEFFTKWSEND